MFRKVSKRTLQLATLCAALAERVAGCAQVDSFDDIQNAIASSLPNEVVLLCPFSVVRGDENAVGLPVRQNGVKVICAKDKVDDKCEIKGEARHLEIMGDGVTVLGFDFIGSKKGAIAVINGRGTSIIDCNFQDNDRTADVQGNGGAIDIRHNTSGTFIIGSNFERNKATNGGAVFGGDVTLISSIFTDNGAKGGHGGAVNLDSGVIRNSTFSFNIAAGDGPSVYTDGGVCPNGLNYACHGSDYQENTCNGILSSLNGGICNKFATSCAYPSASPSSTLTRVPTAIPTVHQSTYPTERPTRSPTFSPTKIPTMSPTPDSTSDPTKGPSSTPTISPTKSVSSVPSALPSNLPSEKPSFSLSSFPTSTPTFEESSGPSLNSSLSPSSIPTTEPSSTRSSGEATSWPSQILPSLSKLPTNAPTSILTSKPSSLQTFMPSSTPSTSVQPTVTCNMSQEDRSAEIDLIVSSLGNTDVNGEAQKEAVKWLVESDSYYVCPQSDHVVQRYAAAVVNKVLLQKDELSSEHECNWDGFTCDAESNIIGVDYKTRDTSAKKLPEELSLFEDMENLVIQNSQLTGRIPPSIFELQHLQQIDLDKNAMSGVITPVVNNTLERLDINFNEFSGSIDFLTAFPNLVEAHLDNNMFNGTIPSELGQLSSLHILTLHENSLSGTMPESVCDLRRNYNLKYLMADCKGPNPKVVCDCCTHCSPY